MTRALRLIWLAALATVVVGSVLSAESVALRLVVRAAIDDKAEHLIGYAVLALLPSLDSFRCRRLRATIAFLFLLGAALEVTQLFSPGRTCDWHDLIANCCGIVAGVVLGRLSSFAFRLHGQRPSTLSFFSAIPPVKPESLE